MNDDQLRALLQQSVRDLRADPEVGDHAWRTAVQQERRQRFAVVAGATTAAALVTVLIANPPSLDRASPPVAPASSSDPSVAVRSDKTQGPAPSKTDDADMRQQGWSQVTVRELPWRQVGLPTMLVPDLAQARPLSADPMGTAVAVMQSNDESITNWSQVTIYLLGEDDRWRSLAAADLGLSGTTVYEDYSLLGRGALSPDGKSLSFKDSGAIGYVDLTSGQVKRFDVPWREPLTPNWDEAGRALFTANRYGNTNETLRVDIESGKQQPSPISFFGSTFADDGTAFEVTDQGYKKAPPELRTYDESGLISAVPLSIPVFNVNALAVADDVALERYTLDEAGDIGRRGFTILDGSSGEALVHLDIDTTWAGILGWIDAETVMFMVSDRQTYDSYGTDFIAWNSRTGSFSRVSRVAPGWFAIVNDDVLGSR